VKRWPLDRFLALADALAEQGDTPAPLLAGEVEAERFTAGERADFAAAGGNILTDLGALADELAAATLVVGNDSGPAHLSAQLGVPTLALFGPTDPDVWSPIGPHVRVLAPGAPGPIEALPVNAVIEQAADALLAARFHRPRSDRPIITRLE
jgi:ADP-heptose:LPS heptosyltransferase